MVVETSAAVAIIMRENDCEYLLHKVLAGNARYMSAVSYMEASVVLMRKRGPGADRELDELLSVADITVVPVDAVQAKLARSAYAKFGKGRHKAGLNLGDCFSYALAKWLNEPLLFKGNDFSQTDIQQT